MRSYFPGLTIPIEVFIQEMMLSALTVDRKSSSKKASVIPDKESISDSHVRFVDDGPGELSESDQSP